MSSTSHQRLLGGGSNEGKISKLAALAARRKQRDIETPAKPSKEADDSPHEYVSLLDKLTLANHKSNPLQKASTMPEHGNDDKTAHDSMQIDGPDSGNIIEEPVIVRKMASEFASILNTSEDGQRQLDDIDTIPQSKALFDFTTPSPDDIVHIAQTGRPR